MSLIDAILIGFWALVSVWVLFAASVVLFHYGTDPTIKWIKKILKKIGIID